MSYSQTHQLITRIQEDMRQAMKDRDRTRLDVLRSLSTQLSNAEAVQAKGVEAGIGVGSTELARRQLTLDEIRGVIVAELHEIEAALNGIDETSAYAVDLRQKMAIIQEYIQLVTDAISPST